MKHRLHVPPTPATGATLLLCLLLALPSSAEVFRRHGRQFSVGPNPCSIAAADLNDDGIPDIVTADRGNMVDPREEKPANDELSLLISRAQLEYENQPPLRAGFAPYCVVLVNVDAYKALDIVVGNFHAVQGRNVTLFHNIVDQGIFEPRHFAVPDELVRYRRMRDQDERPIFTTPGITSLAVRDFSGDGYRDVVATGWSGDALLYFPGHAEQFFLEPKVIRAAGGPRDLAVHDFDNDGKTDLVTTMYVSGEVALWRGDGAGGFEEVNRFQTRGRLPHKVQVGDINRDGNADIAVSHCFADDSIVIFYGDGGFSFPVSQEIALGEDREVAEREIRDLVLQDFNGDGRLDMAAACYASSNVVVLVNGSDGSAVPQKFGRETYAFKNGRPRALCSADLNQDEKPDLAVALWEANAVAFLLAQ